MLRSIVIATATIAIAAQVPTTKKIINLAKIGNEIISQSDFELFLQNLLTDQQRIQLQQNNEAKEQALDYFLKLKIMTAKAQKEGLQKKSAYIHKISIARMQILAQSLMEQALPAIENRMTIADEDIKKYFNNNQDKFKTPETFSARHILVSNKNTNDDAKYLTDEELQTKIAKIKDELNNGKSFADAAKEYSDDPGSRDKGGLYEDVAFGKFATEFEQAVRNQEINKVGNPIKTQYGYHLIEVKKISPATLRPFDEVKESVKEVVTAELRNLEMEKYFNTISKEVGYKKFDIAAK